METHFYKIQGTGNDFVFIDTISQPGALKAALAHWRCSEPSDLTKNICHRKFGIGADGLVILKSSDSCDFKWDFYNSDGSPAEMCGNAARCATLYALTKLHPEKNNISLETIAGTVQGCFASNGDPVVSMTDISNFEPNLNLDLSNGSKINVALVNSGVPHAVVHLPKFITDKTTHDLCKQIRNNKKFQPNGANTSLYSEIASNHIKSVSFERGVEDFTLACGTGAVAAAYSYTQSQKQNSNSVLVDVPGGQLIVHIEDKKTKLQGPAKIVFSGSW